MGKKFFLIAVDPEDDRSGLAIGYPIGRHARTLREVKEALAWQVRGGWDRGGYRICTPAEFPLVGVMECTDDAGAVQPILIERGALTVKAFGDMLLDVWPLAKGDAA